MKFETPYSPQSLPPMAQKKYFVTMAEINYGQTYKVIGDIVYSYDEAQSKRIFNSFFITDSFVRGFYNKEDAEEFISKYQKLNAA